MGDGIAAAQQQFFALPAQAAVRKIVVLTDGQTNDEDRCYQLAEQTQIPFMLGGIGDDYNGRLLNEMARSARGIAEYIDRAEAVGDFFKEVLVTVQSTVMTNARLQLDFRQRFRPKRIHQVSPELKSFDFTPVTPTNRHTQVHAGRHPEGRDDAAGRVRLRGRRRLRQRVPGGQPGAALRPAAPERPGGRAPTTSRSSSPTAPASRP